MAVLGNFPVIADAAIDVAGVKRGIGRPTRSGTVSESVGLAFENVAGHLRKVELVVDVK